MNRDFKGVWIPREVWLNRTISNNAKILWSEIWSLHDRESGGCYASNEYLSEFMNVKLSRLKEIMKELRDADLLEDVSFDGRQRIIRAKIPPVDYGGQQLAGKPATPQPENRPPPSRKTGHPIYGIEQSLEQSLEHSYSSAEKTGGRADALPAEAGEVEGALKCRRKKKIAEDYPPEVQDMVAKMLALLAKHCPVYRPPEDMTNFFNAVKKMLIDEKQDPNTLLKTFEWGVSDTLERGTFKGWQGILVTNKKAGKPTSPAAIFSTHFGKIFSQMKSKPARKFAPSSDDEKTRQIAERMMEGAL
jgi:hypothetical protein